MRVAVIGTFHERRGNTFPLMHRLFVDALRKPDEAWVMCESSADADAVEGALGELVWLGLLEKPVRGLNLIVLPTPKQNDGKYAVIPYSHKINYALDRTRADAVAYLDNGSRPSPDKYRLMVAALEQHPGWGAVYCSQQRTGMRDEVSVADAVVPDAFSNLNYTQVMHRVTDDRWDLDMRWADPDLADARFWRRLHRSLGPFYPVGGELPHDWHHIPDQKAVGV